MMIGWDGADWDLVLPLVESGRLPNLERLMRGGTYGTLHSMVPSNSPSIWTTVATGVSPARHGITHFYDQQPPWERWFDRLLHFGTLHRQLFSNQDRRTRAVWNVLTDRGRSVLVTGYHNTFPVEVVNGAMVSNYLVQDSVGEILDAETEVTDESPFAASLVYPQAQLDEILAIQTDVQRRVVDALPRFVDLPPDEIVDYVRHARQLEEDANPYILVRAWTFDTIVAETALAFLRRELPTLAMVHFQGVDWASHRFYYHQDPRPFTGFDWSPEQRERLEAERPIYDGTIEAFYVYLDEWLGRLLALRDEGTAVLLMSDHGFEPFDDPWVTGKHFEAPPGMVVLEGPGIRSGRLDDEASVYDILPTLMAGLDLPIADDLPGAPIESAFCPAAWASGSHETVPTYGTGDFVPTIARSDDLDSRVLQQLESLGYLD
jgi:predicted AlkP superfamily pyrophosphatase or phosphodiesterase